MIMTDQEQKNLRSYCADLLKQHGIQFTPDEPIVPPLYVIHKDMELNNRTNKEIASLIQEALSRINPKEFNFNSEEAAWKFQMGITLRWGLIGLLALMLIWVAAWRWSMANDVDRARTIIGASDNISELLKRTKKINEGSYIIDFTAAKGDSTQRFVEYEKLNSKTVRIYLGRDTRTSKP